MLIISRSNTVEGRQRIFDPEFERLDDIKGVTGL
jgi:hypothetical protein